MKDEEKAKGNQSSDDILAELNAHHEVLNTPSPIGDGGIH